MYFKITTKCNMRCGHCCVSAEPGKGDNMSLETFRKALEIAEDTGSYIVLGGGEPTVHPHFEIILLEAMTASCVEDSPVLVITNGKNKRRALMLAHLAKKGAIHAELSTDHYHEPVDPKVYQTFEGHYRDVTSGHRGRPLLVGRYLEEVGLTWEETPPNEECVCDDWVVEPDGTIRQCGCPDSPIVGNVHTGLYPEYAHCSGMCYRSKEYAERMDEFNDMIEKAVA